MIINCNTIMCLNLIGKLKCTVFKDLHLNFTFHSQFAKDPNPSPNNNKIKAKKKKVKKNDNHTSFLFLINDIHNYYNDTKQ